MRRQFRHCDTSYNGCPCSNSGTNHNCCVDNGRRYDPCGSNYDRGTDSDDDAAP